MISKILRTNILPSATATAVLIALFAVGGFAQGNRFNATDTFEFDPENLGGVNAFWEDGIGLPDYSCRTSFGLRLRKNRPAEDPVAAGAILRGLRGEVVDSEDVLGYDIRNNSPCTAGSPRFNVSYTLPDGTNGFSFVGGCANDDERHAAPQGRNWTRVTFNLQDPNEAFPVIPTGAQIEAVALIIDEPGRYTIDNIQFSGQFADKPGASGPEPFCREEF